MLQYSQSYTGSAFSLRRLYRSALQHWLDGIERGWSIPLLLVAFVATWVVVLMLAYSNAGLHPDVLETWSLGRDFAWGSAKHPPLMGWIARAWTALFPLTDWSFQLLAMTNAAVALWAVDLTTRRFVSGDKRVIVLLLLMLLPAYQFHAQRFNANSVLLATWPLAIYCFLRAYETRGIGWAALSGATAGLAMLGKYYSIFLIASMVAAALLHPQRRQYLRSAAPWVTVLAGLAVIGPHLSWLVASDFPPFSYAMRTHGGLGLSGGASKAVMFSGGVLAWLVIPVAAWMLLTRSRIETALRDLSNADGGLLLLSLVLLGTLLMPALVAIVLGTSMPALWNLQGLFLAVVVLVCTSRVTDVREPAIKLTTAVCLFSLVMIVAAPLHAYVRNDHPFKEGRSFYKGATAELVRRWRNETRAPLLAISGNDDLALAAAFYAEDHPYYNKMFNVGGLSTSIPGWAYNDGWAAMCFATDTFCVTWIEKMAAAVDRRSVSVAFDVPTEYLGQAGATARIQAIMVPPETKPQDEPDNDDDDDMVEYSSQRRPQ
ncbi:glycosyltransferase family 39 protein [Afipia sp. P52-10]|uniref:glycosyltransferase family 39 protein n=1 Tax=Afipia sp. P52-10 TaxID=1429916 RepID=UPI0004B5576E|nr:glycosyltransferase family 39 protein [Afipia sp. P52-10]